MTDLVPATTPAVIVERDERTVRLGDVGIARENLRFNEPPDDDIPTLAATMKAAGQLQRLTVRPGRGKKEDPWMALDGRRRRLALGLLLDAGEVDENYPVTVYVETDPARQAAAVLLTGAISPRIGARPRTRLPVTIGALLGPRARGLALPSGRLAFLAGAAPLAYEVRAWTGEGRDVGLYQAHALARIVLPEPRPHPSPLVESGPMASVAPPAPTYRPVLPPAMREQQRQFSDVCIHLRVANIQLSVESVLAQRRSDHGIPPSQIRCP